MKQLFAFALLVLGLGTSTVMAQDPMIGPPMDGAVIEFEQETLDFGTLPHKGDASGKFVFWNKGSADLILSKCQGSCGCTVPACPTEAIKPGERGEIKVTYDSNRIGSYTKNVTVISNAINGQSKTLTIKGTIEAPVTPPVDGTAGQTPAPSPVPAPTGGH